MTRSLLPQLRHRPGRRGSLARRTASLLTGLALAVLPTVALPALSATAAGTGANFIATGHDQDYHCRYGSTPSCQFLKASVDSVRKGSTLPVLSIDSGSITTIALANAGVTPVVAANPRVAATFNAVPLVDGSGAKLYSAIVVGSSSYVADITSADSANINARSADIKTFFNAGGGILAQSGAGMPGYYNFVPISITAVSVSPPFTVTTRGAEVGFTSDMANCCPTHNAFSTPTDPVVTLETDSLGTATTIAAFDATIGDGGFSNAPVVTITGGATVYTSDTTPTVSGTTDAPVGSTVTVTIGGQTLTATVTTGGAWSVTPTELAEGSYPVVASITVAGKTGTAEQSIVVDTTPPTVAIDGGATRTTNDSTPLIAGTTTAPVGSVVTVTVDGQTLSATVVSGGTWSVTAATLAEGPYDVSATAVDEARNTVTATQSLIVDMTAPIIAITGGESVSTTHGDQPIAGTSDAAAGSTVTVTVGSQTLTTAVSDTGTWSVTPVGLPDGEYTITASVADVAGNVGTGTQALLVDTTPPTLTIDGPDPAFVASKTPTVSGTTDAPAGTVVTVVVGAQAPLSATVTEAGTWSVTTAAPLPEGLVEVSATVSDLLGNARTVTRTLTVDTVAPLLTITGGSRVATNDPTPTVSGTTDAPAGSRISVVIDGDQYSPVVDAQGRWSVTPGEGPNSLLDGEHVVTVTVTDEAGNTTIATQALVVDREAPSLAFDVSGPVAFNTATPTVSGTSDAPQGSRVIVTAGTAEASGTVGADGTWSVDLPALPDGEYVVRATVTDEAQNASSEAQRTLVVDTTAPVGTITSPALTGSTTPTISGTTDAPADSPVLVVIDGDEFHTVVGSDGTWSLILETPLSEGAHAVRVGFIDAVGNVGAAEQVLTVDTTPPAGDLDGGDAPLGNTATPVISGTTDAPAGSTVTVTVGGLTLATTVGSDGTWTVTVPEPGLGDGAYPVTVVITDPAGNPRTLTQSLSVDTTAPTGSFDAGGTTTITSPSVTISGITDAPVGSTVVVTVRGLTLTTTVAPDGTWSVEALGLLVGDYTVTATFTDAAGNILVLNQHLIVTAPAPTSTSTTPRSNPSSYTPTTSTTTTTVPLAYTGTDMSLPLTGGLGLLTIGAGLALAFRRRRGEHV